jgi:hypothetical protein
VVLIEKKWELSYFPIDAVPAARILASQGIRLRESVMARTTSSTYKRINDISTRVVTEVAALGLPVLQY